MDNILVENNNFILIDNKLKCKDSKNNIKDNTLITILPNPIIEDLYINDKKIGEILNNNIYFVSILNMCIPKEFNDTIKSQNIYFIEKIDVNLNEYIEHNHIGDIQKLFSNNIIIDKKKLLNPNLLYDFSEINSTFLVSSFILLKL